MKVPTIIFSVDGMRPDALLVANTPRMKRLIAEGAWTMAARTVMPSVTLPCHTSMFRGVDVARHGITTNTFQPLARPVPSLLDVAKENGLKTGMFFNWAELRDLAAPASITVSYLYNDAYSMPGDDIVTQAAIENHEKYGFDLLFVYLGYTDECGHQHGWMSEPYLRAVENADACIGRVLAALGTANVLVISDHGGHERSHGTEMAEDMKIPLILHGPAFKSGFEIPGGVRIFDACPTMAHVAGLPLHRTWDGRVISDALV